MTTNTEPTITDLADNDLAILDITQFPDELGDLENYDCEDASMCSICGEGFAGYGMDDEVTIDDMLRAENQEFDKTE